MASWCANPYVFIRLVNGSMNIDELLPDRCADDGGSEEYALVLNLLEYLRIVGLDRPLASAVVAQVARGGSH